MKARVLGIGCVGVLAALVASGCGSDSSHGDDDDDGGVGGDLGGGGSKQAGGSSGSAARGGSNTGGSGAATSGGSAGSGATTGGTAAVAGTGGDTASVGGSGAVGGSSGGAGITGDAGGMGEAGTGALGGSGGTGGSSGSSGASGATSQPGDNWHAVWNGTSSDYGRGVAVTANHIVIAAGIFGSASIDLDPTAGEDVRQHLRPVTTGTVSNQDAFVVWLNPDGTYRSGCTLPGDPGSFGNMVMAAGKDDAVILAGAFSGTVDFDPGPGQELITATGSGATYVASFTPDCELLWAYQLYDSQLGGDYLLAARNRPLATDAAGNVYLAGWFVHFDFDLGPGTADTIATPSGSANGFLLKLEPDAGLSWVKPLPVVGVSTVAVSRDGDTVVVGGAFGGTVDLDPTAEEDMHTAVGTTDAYALAFDADGGFLWSYAYNRDATSRFSLDTIAVGADGTAILGARDNLYLEYRGADGEPLWIWDIAYKVRSAEVMPDGRLALLGRLSENTQPNPADGPNPTPPFYGREFVSVFEPNGNFVSSLAFGASSVDTTGDQLVFDDGYVYVSGTLSVSPTGDSSYLPQGDGEDSIRVSGEDDAFLFRYKLP